jgi:RimJ/RimL family protein N-acetyltransferase
MSTALGANPAPGWLISLGGRIIGDCGTFGWPDHSGEVEIGYGLAEPYRGQGYGTEAVQGLCGWLSVHAGARRITADVLDVNVASRRLLTKLGFIVTARRGEHVTYVLDVEGRAGGEPAEPASEDAVSDP